jgi:hypothetical protein
MSSFCWTSEKMKKFTLLYFLLNRLPRAFSFHSCLNCIYRIGIFGSAFVLDLAYAAVKLFGIESPFYFPWHAQLCST